MTTTTNTKQRTTLNIAPLVITDVGVDVGVILDIQQRVVDAILSVPEVETVVCRRSESVEVRSGYCEPGQHDFVVDHYFPDDRPVPPVCRAHAYQGAIDAATAEHAPLFEAVAERTGLTGHIWQSGGMTMTICIPLPDAVDGYPCYLGLKEGEEDDGRWYGSVGFYTTPDDDEGVEVTSQADMPLLPDTWALLIENHYKGMGR